MDSEDEQRSVGGQATPAPDGAGEDETVFVTGHVFAEEGNDEEGGAGDNQELMTEGDSGGGLGERIVSQEKTPNVLSNVEVDAGIAADKETIEGGRLPVKTELQSPDKFNALLSSVISSPSQSKEGNEFITSLLEGEKNGDEEADLLLPPISIKKNIFEEEEEPEQVISSESNPILPAPTQTPAVPCSNVSNVPSGEPMTSGSGASTTDATNKVPDKVLNKKSVSSLRFKKLSKAKRNLIKNKNSFGACNCEAMWKKERSVKNRLLSKIKDLTGAVLELTKRHTLLEDFVHVRHEEEFRTFAREHDQLRTLGYEERDPDITKRPETWREGGSNIVDLLTTAKYGEQSVEEMAKKMENRKKSPRFLDTSTAQCSSEEQIVIHDVPIPPSSYQSSWLTEKSNQSTGSTSSLRNETEGIIKPARLNLNESSSSANPFYQHKDNAPEQGIIAGPSGGGWGRGWGPFPSTFGDQFSLRNQMNPEQSIFPMQSTNSPLMGGGIPQGPHQEGNAGRCDNTIPSFQAPSTSQGFHRDLTPPPRSYQSDPATGIIELTKSSKVKRKNEEKEDPDKVKRTRLDGSSSASTGNNYSTYRDAAKRPPLFAEMPDDLTEEQLQTLKRIYKPQERFVGESKKEYRERILFSIGVTKINDKYGSKYIRPPPTVFDNVQMKRCDARKLGLPLGKRQAPPPSTTSKSSKPLSSSASCPDLDGDGNGAIPTAAVTLSKLNITMEGSNGVSSTSEARNNGATNAISLEAIPKVKIERQ